MLFFLTSLGFILLFPHFVLVVDTFFSCYIFLFLYMSFLMLHFVVATGRYRLLLHFVAEQQMFLLNNIIR